MIVPDIATHAGQLQRGTRPSFSVNMPVYQAADTVREAIESVLAQTEAPLEIILCDDGSTDDLAGALAPFAAQITLLHQEHSGAAAARNMCLSHSTGEFVLVCDADDALMPRAIEALGDFAIARPDLDMLCRTSYYAQNGTLVGVSRTPEAPRFPVGDQRVGIILENFVPASVAVRRSRLLEVGGYDARVRAAVDYEMWVRVILAGARAGLLLEPLHIYRLRPGSLSTNDVWRTEGCITAITKALGRSDLSHGERTAARRRLRLLRADLERALAKQALMEGRPDVRRRCLRVALGQSQTLRNRVRAAAAVAAPQWIGAHVKTQAEVARQPST